jgi:hypothetical protein
MRRHHTRRDQPSSTAPDVDAFLTRVRPGETLELVVNPASHQPPDVRRTVLLDLDPSRGIVVAQPNRKILPTTRMPPLEATVVLRDRAGDTARRWGFATAITAFLDAFQLAESTQEALVLAWPREVHPANLRAAFRVALPASLTPPLTLLDAPQHALDGQAELVNVSTGGALLRYRQVAGAQPWFHGGESLILQVDFSALLAHLAVRLYAAQADLARVQVSCRIVHTHPEAGGGWQALGVAFTDLTQPQEDLLHAIVLKLQTAMAARGLA